MVMNSSLLLPRVLLRVFKQRLPELGALLAWCCTCPNSPHLTSPHLTSFPTLTILTQTRTDNGLEAVLRRGLERFHFGDAGGDHTHGDTDFIEAAMTAARRDA